MTSDVKQKIQDALQRGAQFDAHRITVEVDGHKVILHGTARSHGEMRDAERAAQNAPGIADVESRLTVRPVRPEDLNDTTMHTSG